MKTIKAPAVYSISLDEIIFAHKNKDYGAYLLRSHYARNMSVALLLSVSIFTIFSISSIVINHVKQDETRATRVPRTITLEVFSSPKNNQQEIGRPAGIINHVSKPMVRFVAPKIVDYNPADDKLIPTVDQLINVIPGLENRDGDVNGIDLVIPPDAVIERVNSDIVGGAVKDEPITFAEVMPGYPGGESELLSFISHNVRYPEIAAKAGVEGKVMVQFIVEKDGSLNNVEVVKSIGAGCDDEAIRVCKLMNRWNPGLQNGKAVRVRMVIPFLFKLQ